MDAQVLAHLERIDQLVAALATLPWLEADEADRIRADLLDFDARHWALVRVLSLPLYRELNGLLAAGEAAALLPQRPRLAVVMPLHRARPELLLQALGSLRRQVGVAVDCWISVDGEAQDLQLAESLLAELGADQQSEHWRPTLLFSSQNRGVGMCRNLALGQLSAPFFSCLDADDIFHPLRCLHALLVLVRQGLMRLNTGWCRASLLEQKIVLINDRLSHLGHNSFVARSELLLQCGYQADLRFFEDTEFMLRHRFYGVAMADSPVVGHYLHTEPRADYQSLASPCRQEVHAITGHPYLCGSVISEQPDSWRAIEQRFRERYLSLPADELPREFGAPAPDEVPGRSGSADA
ncbi:MAG: glycosyltransferase family 2 protein [Cyanobium sp.]